MPGLDELKWQEYVDFSGGLWERGNDRDCAPNGLLEATDCYPQPWGGIKAFCEFEPIRMPFATGPTNPAWVIGYWALNDSSSNNHYVMTIENIAGAYTFALHRVGSGGGQIASFVSNGLRAGDPSSFTWTRIYSQAAVSMDTGIRMEAYRDSASYGAWYNFTHSTNHGVWKAGTTAPAFSGAFSAYGLWVHQGRLVTVTDDGSGVQQNKIIYTDAGSTAAPSTANFLLPFGEHPSPIRALLPSEPSEFLVWKDYLNLGDIQGPIVTPTVRGLVYQHMHVRNFPVHTPVGVVSVVFNEGAFAWNGNTLDHISPQILGDPMGGTVVSSDEETGNIAAVGSDLEGCTLGVNRYDYAQVTGQLGCYEHWVFFNNGYVMDSRTGAWFKQTSAPGARYWASDPYRRLLMCSCRNSFRVNSGGFPIPDVMYFSEMGESAWTKAQTYSFTLPLIENPAQKINVREIEYELYAYNSESTITVEVTNATETLDALGPYSMTSGSNTVRVLIPGHPSDWYKVRTVLKSNRAKTEAPTMTRMRVGTQDSTRNPVNR